MKIVTIVIIISFLSIHSFSQVPPPTLYTGESYTTLYSASYDYQSNGSVRQFLQNPAAANELFAVMMGVRDSNDPPPFNLRYSYIALSTNDGVSWFSEQLGTTRSGFPQAEIIDGVEVITHHQGSPNTVKVFKDVVFGAFAFNEYTPTPLAPNGTWAGVTGNPSGPQMTVIASVNNVGGPFPINKITSPNGSSWSSWSPLSFITGPSGCHTLFSAAGGLTGIAGFDYDGSLVNRLNGKMYYYKSTNYGVTIDSIKLFFSPYYIGKLDTLYHDADAGMQGIYSSNEPHIVFGVYSSAAYVLPNSFLEYRYSKILHWSPSTGITTIADNLNSPAITDSINNTLVGPRCHPTIGRLANGTLVCAFTGLTRGHLQPVGNGETFSTGDIYLSYSTNNGLNWSAPSNFTNTANIEEKHPSILPSSLDNTVRIIYYRDMKAGYYALDNTLGKAPYYCIMKKTTLTGINNHIETPLSFSLSQNFPNPFNPETRIKFSIPKKDFTSLKIYDALGREISTLINSVTEPGEHTVNFNAHELPSGIYFYTLSSGDFIKTNKMVLVK